MELTVPVIGILRGVAPDFFRALLGASFDAGLQAIEVTMNTPGAEKMVSDCRSLVPAGCLLGMGTVCTLNEARRAVAAGAMFLVSPNLDLEVVAYARAQRIPMVAGALTPTEVYAAWRAGADLIKIFPCRAMGGPQYIKDLLGPFGGAPLVPVGGVDAATVRAYLEAGARAVGAGPTLFGKSALERQDVTELARNVTEFLARL